MSNDDWQIVPQRDEAVARSRNRPAEARRPQANAGAEAPGKPAKSESGERRGGGSGLSTVLFLLLLVSFAGSGYLFMQTQDLLENQHDLRGRLATVEGKLSVTDESVSQSGAAMQAILRDHSTQLETQMTEIRKLWGVAYDTNRKAIDELKVLTATLTRRMDESVAGLARLNTLPADLGQVRERTDAANSQLLIMKADVEDAVSRMRTTRDELNTLTRNLAGLQGANEEYAEAIQSIDAFRLQINQRLIQLENEVRSLRGAP